MPITRAQQTKQIEKGFRKMPKVGGKKFSYTPEGQLAAAKARLKKKMKGGGYSVRQMSKGGKLEKGPNS